VFYSRKAVPASETPCFNPNEIEKTHIRVTSGTHRSYQPESNSSEHSSPRMPDHPGPDPSTYQLCNLLYK